MPINFFRSVGQVFGGPGQSFKEGEDQCTNSNCPLTENLNNTI